jgi:uncharacterized phage-associated protein
MAFPALSAAHTLCQVRDWSISNLELQKILYLAHMYHMASHGGAPLINEAFEAWDYGPVVPVVYRHVKGFGSGPIKNVFHWIPSVPLNAAEYKTLREVSDNTRSMTAGQLVANTHWDSGAWASVYRPNTHGLKISNAAILDEYRRRSAHAQPAT